MMEKNAKTPNLFIRIPDELFARAEVQRKRLEVSKAAMIRMALVRWCEEQEGAQRQSQR